MAGQTAPEHGYRERNSTADRAIDILLRFTEQKLTWTAAEIAAELGVARSTSYRYLQSLVTAGLLEEAERGFQLGPRVLELARLARRGAGLSDIARPAMTELVEISQESVLLTRRSRGHIVCVDVVSPSHPIRLSYEPGYVLPLNAGAAASVLIAWEDPEMLNSRLALAPLRAFTSHTVTDPDEFRERLRKIVEEGYAISHGELDPDVIGIAAPIRSEDGSVRAAVSIAALSSRVPPEAEPGLVQHVLRTAEQISERMSLYGL